MPRPLFRAGSKPERPTRLAFIFSSRAYICESAGTTLELLCCGLSHPDESRLGDNDKQVAGPPSSRTFAVARAFPGRSV